MKNILLAVCFILFSDVGYSATKGIANMTAGISSDNDSLYKGITADYIIDSESAFQNWNASSQFEYSSAKNRPSVINGHQYLYTDSVFNINAYHLFKLPSPFWIFDSGASYKQTGELDITGKRLYGWNTYFGPTFNRKLRSDIDLKLNASFGSQMINQVGSEDKRIAFTLRKYFNRVTSILLFFKNECVDYDDKEEVDTCNNTTSFGFNRKTANTDYKLSIGQADTKDKIERIYTVQVKYGLSLTDTISIISEIEALSPRTTLGASDDTNLVSASKVERQIISYYKSLSRLDISATAERVKIPKLDEELKYQLSSSYLISIKQCHSCSIVFEYQKNIKIEGNWRTWMVGATYPLKRHWNTLLSIRKTTQYFGEDFTSLNIQLNYQGLPKILSR